MNHGINKLRVISGLPLLHFTSLRPLASEGMVLDKIQIDGRVIILKFSQLRVSILKFVIFLQPRTLFIYDYIDILRDS